MTVKKLHAQDGAPLDDCMESILEVLAELLAETEDPACAAGTNQRALAAKPKFHSGDARAIHALANNSEKRRAR